MTSNKMQFTMNVDLNLIARESPTQRILELVIRAPSPEHQVRQTPLNLALIIDRSGSMAGEKLEFVKEAAIHVVHMLQDQDNVALVAYDDQVKVLSPSLPVTSSARQEFAQIISRLTSGNMTNLAGGWLQGCQEIAAAARTGQLVRALLLSDGLANVGITDIEELGHHARQLHDRGVSTSTFGVGAGFNEHLMEQMANQGGGNFYFIQNPNQIPDIFMRELEGLVSVTAQGVEIHIILPDAVECQILGGWKWDQVGRRLRIYLGDLPAGTQREVFARLIFPPEALSEGFVIPGESIALGKNSEHIHEDAVIRLTYTDQQTVKAARPSQKVLEGYSVVLVAETATEALKLERRGETEKASQMLEKTLDEQAAYVPAPQADVYRQMSRRMKRGMDEGDRKVSHSRSYIDKQRRD